jgi:ADP-heptose:LPS heptosyltransferase
MLPGIGDLLCAVPALRALRRGLPNAHVSLVGLPGSEWFVDRFASYVDELIAVPSAPGLAEWKGECDPQIERRFRSALASARRMPLDVALQMHGSGPTTNAFTAALRARRWVGVSPHVLPGSCQPRTGNGMVIRYPDDVHEIDRCNAVVTALGIEVGSSHLEFPVAGHEVTAARRLLVRTGVRAVVHSGASRPDRRWSPAHFARVVDHLSDTVGPVALTGGPAEREIVAEVAARAAAPTLDLSGRTRLGVLAAVLSLVEVVVGNDTGVAHLAVATGTPTVTVVGTSERHRWAHDVPPHVAVGGSPTGRWPAVDQVVDAVARRPGRRPSREVLD